MKNDFWEIGVLPREDYYKRVLLDGCIVQKDGIEMCDLRFHYKKYRDEHSPKIQLYKSDHKGSELVKMFHNFDEALSEFFKISEGN
jgi:hypothetical protein